MGWLIEVLNLIKVSYCFDAIFCFSDILTLFIIFKTLYASRADVNTICCNCALGCSKKATIEHWWFYIQEGARGPKKRFYKGLENSYSRGPKRAQEGPGGPTRRFYRGLEILYSRGPKRAQECPRRDSIEDWRFRIQEGPRVPTSRFYRGMEISYSRGPKRAQEGPKRPKRAQDEIL